MEHIPKEDLDEMDLDEQMNSDQEDVEAEDDVETEEEPEGEQKEIFIPGKHKLEEGEELVRDERYNFRLLFLSLVFLFIALIHSIMNFKPDHRAYHLIL